MTRTGVLLPSKDCILYLHIAVLTVHCKVRYKRVPTICKHIKCKYKNSMNTVCAHFWYSCISDFTMHSENSNIRTVDAQEARIINLYSMYILLALFYICILYI